VIAVDTNILVYAHREDAEWHARALDCLTGLAEGAAAWAIPWPCIHEFLAVVTHPRICGPPSPVPAALDQVAAWLESPVLVLLGEGPTHWLTLRTAVETARAAGSLVHDARITALCQEHGVRELWSADRDFGRFAGLRVRNPLVG
jgi:hypothetical protein